MLSATRHSFIGFALVAVLVILTVVSLAAAYFWRAAFSSLDAVGNLSAQTSALASAEMAVAAAAQWLSGQSDQALRVSRPADGYFAFRQDPSPGETWSAFWRDTLAAGYVKTVPSGEPGYTAAYVIHRLCAVDGDPSAPETGCLLRVDDAETTSRSTTAAPITGLAQTQYRITARAEGPRGAVGFVQAFYWK